MKIALIGYGKMGRMIESVALSRGHEITCRIDRDTLEDFDSKAFLDSEVAIEFSTPATAAENVLRCFRANVPVVCGSTGWSDRLPEMRELCEAGKGSLIWASNFSVGVNIFMAINRELARIMSKFPDYTPSMTEVHHIHKLDHPSGTAITLAEEIIEENNQVSGWQEPDMTGHVDTKMLPIACRREGEVPGIHTIRWDSKADMIEITHSANSREGFALGAVLAAEWLPSHPGWHTVAEVLDI